MFQSRAMTNKINGLHERCLQIVYSDNKSYYEELMRKKKKNSVLAHHSNSQSLAIELYKILNDFSPIIMKDVFLLNLNSVYNTRNRRTFSSRRVRTIKYGTGSIAFLTLKIWELIPNNFKNLDSLAAFKSAAKRGNRNCLCWLYKTFML